MAICLNVGCHDIHIQNFINIDLDPAMKPDLLLDATKLPDKFPEGTVDFIYCGHFLEHLPAPEGVQVCKDFFNILRPYASVVAVVPDADACTPAMPYQEREEILLAGGLHKVLMTEGRLRTYFEQAGFQSLYKVSPKDIPHCRFGQVHWQTAILAIKHPPVIFRPFPTPAGTTEEPLGRLLEEGA